MSARECDCRAEFYEGRHLPRCAIFTTPDVDRPIPMHPFVGYDANPNICRTCGAVYPMPCYQTKGNPRD